MEGVLTCNREDPRVDINERMGEIGEFLTFFVRLSLSFKSVYFLKQR